MTSWPAVPPPEENPHPEQFDAALAALGKLDPAEQAAFAAHAAHCSICRAEAAGFGELVGRMSRVPYGVVDAMSDDDPENAPDLALLPDDDDVDAVRGLRAAMRAVDGDRPEALGDYGLSVLLERARSSHRRRVRLSVGASLVGVAAAVLVGFVAAGNVGSDSRYRVTVPLAGGSITPAAHGSFTLTDDSEGTHLTIAATGLPAGEHCTLVVTTPDHQRDVVMTWVADYDGEAVLNGPSPIAASQADSVSVIDDSGRSLLQGALRRT
jgi:hypothetical protein